MLPIYLILIYSTYDNDINWNKDSKITVFNYNYKHNSTIH